MEKLTTKEEEIMQVLWQLKKAFVKEVVAHLPVPKLHYNTYHFPTKFAIEPYIY